MVRIALKHTVFLLIFLISVKINAGLAQNKSVATPSTKKPLFPSSFRYRTKHFHHSDRNVPLYSMQQILERKFYKPEDYVLNEKELISNDHDDSQFRDPTAAFQKKIASSSLIMTFVILGSVILFIAFVYVNHIISERKMRELERRENIRTLMETSMALLASSGHKERVVLGLERRSSLLDAFRKFRL